MVQKSQGQPPFGMYKTQPKQWDKLRSPTCPSTGDFLSPGMDLVVTINDDLWLTATKPWKPQTISNDVQDVVLQRFVGIDASIFMPSKWGKPAGLGFDGWLKVEVEIFSKPSLLLQL